MDKELKIFQSEIHFRKEHPTERDRILREYDDSFDVPRGWLRDKLLEFCRKGKVVYADFGCGDGVALREAKILASENNLSRNLNTIGIDVLPMDEEKIRERIKKYPDDYSVNFANPEFRPNFIEVDYEIVVLPEKVDISTAAETLYYTPDPLRALSNILAQTKNGGITCVNGLSRIHVTSSPIISEGFDQGNLFGRFLNWSEGSVPGFEIVHAGPDIRTVLGPNAIVLLKKNSIEDPFEMSRLLGFNRYTLKDSGELKSQGGLIYYYWPKGVALPGPDEKLEEVIERQISSVRVGKRMIQ